MRARTIGTILALIGALLLADAAATLAWREPVSALLAERDAAASPQRLDEMAARLERELAGRVERGAAPAARMALAAQTLATTARPGDPLGTLRIDRIGLRTAVVQGTGAPELRAGPGHYAATALPGERGTVGLAGHRTTYRQPFRRLDALRRGDRITLTLPYGRFTYRVARSQVVAPGDVGVLARRRGRELLVLTACHPLFSAAQRLVVTAALVESEPRGIAADGTPA